MTVLCGDSHESSSDFSLSQQLSQGMDPSPLDNGKRTVVLCHLNAQSLLPKMDEIRSFLMDVKRPIVLGISETWLNSSVCDCEIEVHGYTMYRRDRGERGASLCARVLSELEEAKTWRMMKLRQFGVSYI